ncbi:hypothetical protein LIER_17407 [Lithospermum erythrorhizon]|uniref:Aminotransferase-like plant mobile domain-containing protein n=1 Tax=Lithospermum erythrorhizon TaxID=34254 RepID=A0AAV3QCK4_LITER
MVTFSIEEEHPNLRLRIHDHKEEEDTILAAYPPLHRSRSTNTLLLPHGKVSISLWDLYKLGDLPIAGHLMDEVVPSAEPLSSSLGKKERIPQSCRFLLHAYHSLVTSSSDRIVSPVEWISFWSALPRGYTRPSTVENDRAGSLSLPCCPCGSIAAHGSCTAESLRVFKHLGIPYSLVDEVYCAAFLSCWFCTFFLALDVTGSIRPSVFKMATCMATYLFVDETIPS